MPAPGASSGARELAMVANGRFGVMGVVDVDLIQAFKWSEKCQEQQRGAQCGTQSRVEASKVVLSELERKG